MLEKIAHTDVPLERADSKKKWSAPGIITLAAVIAFGLILSLGGYITLSSYVGNPASSKETSVDLVAQLITEESDEILSTFEKIHWAASATPDTDSLQKIISEWKNIPQIFDGVSILTKEGTSRNLMAFDKNTQRYSPALISHFFNQLSQSSETNIIVLGEGHEKENKESKTSYFSQDRSFYIVSRLNDNNILVAESAGRYLGNLSWFSTWPHFYSISINDLTTKNNLFTVMRHDPIRRNVDKYKKIETDIQVLNKKARMTILADMNVSEQWAQMIPVLALLFGVALTALSTYALHKSRLFASELSKVNHVLARKNQDLKKEVLERESVYQTLNKAKQEYKSMIDAVSDIIFETNTEGKIVFTNQTWQRLTGFALNEIQDQPLFAMFHEEDEAELRRAFYKIAKGGAQAHRALLRLKTVQNKFRSVELSMSVMRKDDTNKIRVVGTMTDVEARHRAEQALDETEKKYRAIVENAAGGIYQITADGQFLSVNPSMVRILKYTSAEDMLTKVRNAYEQVYAVPKEAARMNKELRETGTVNNFETVVYCANKEKIWVNINARAVKDAEGQILYYEGSMENITERKKVDAELREAKIKSDLANRAKTEFLTNMSHELRTPLNVIIGFSEIIKDQVFGELGNKQYLEYANDIHESGSRLLKIINEILDISRIDAGDRQLNESQVSMDEVIFTSIDFLTAKAEENDLIVTNLTAGTIPNVVGEELALKQIFMNLLSNAIKFTPRGGRVTLDHEIDAQGNLRISITDTGVGMDESEIEKAISAFGQLDSEHSRSSSGAGLGLTLVNALVRLHSGKLEIVSQKGIGTTVTVVLPKNRVSALPEQE